MKNCRGCRQPKKLVDFYKDKSNVDGLRPYCKQCSKGQRTKHYAKNREKEKAQTRAWKKANPEKVTAYAKSRAGKAIRKKSNHKYRKNNPVKIKARKAAENAVNTRKIPAVSDCKCEDCYDKAVNYHHESYAKKDWLKVIPLCRPCHLNRHRQFMEAHDGLGFG